MLTKHTSDLPKQRFYLDIDIQRENQFQKLFFKTTLSHISRGCLKSFNDNIDVAILLNMVLHLKE